MHSLLINKTVFIAGSEKNAGKTTMMNYLLKQVRQSVSPAFLTIGIDGEREDLIFGNPKPQIYSEPGDFLVTTDQMIKESSGLFEVRAVFPVKTVLGRLILVKTLRGSKIELVGAENNEQLKTILDVISNQEKIKTILIDGAASRITQLISCATGVMIYVLKVEQRSLNHSVDILKKFSLYRKIPVDEVRSDIYRISGALTEQKVQEIPEECNEIGIEDFTRIFLTYSQLKNLMTRKKLYFREEFRVISVYVNLYNLTRQNFRDLLKQNQIEEEILFNPYVSGESENE